MVKFALIFLLSFWMPTTFMQSDCPCEKFSPKGNPNWTHMPIYIVEKKTFSVIQGNVTDGLDKPVSRQYIYVYRRADNLANSDFSLSKLTDDDFVAACEVDQDGKFCFENIPKGKYAVCVNSAYNSDFIANTTCVLIKLNPQKRKLNRKLEIKLQAAE